MTETEQIIDRSYSNFEKKKTKIILSNGQDISGNFEKLDRINNIIKIEVESENQDQLDNVLIKKEIKLSDIAIIKIENIANYFNIHAKNDFKQDKNVENFEDAIQIDSKLKKHPKFTDDFETCKDKLIRNNYQSSTSDSIENIEFEDLKEIINSKSNYNTLEQISSNNNDQFNLNKNKFNVISTYSQDDYTTKLNRNNVTDEMRIKAEQIEQSILNDRNKSTHILEERGIEQDEDIEEELKYSTVYRNKFKKMKNKENKDIQSSQLNKSNSLFRYVGIFFLIVFFALTISAYFINKKDNHVEDDIEYETYTNDYYHRYIDDTDN